MGYNEDKGVKLFSVRPTHRTRASVQKLKHMKFHLNPRKQLITVRVVKYRNKLPRDVVEPPSLKIFKNPPGHGQHLVADPIQTEGWSR